jgi:hypothetical protein
VTFPSTKGIHKLSNKVKPTGSLLARKPITICCVLTEETVEKSEAQLDYYSQQSLRCLALVT